MWFDQRSVEHWASKHHCEQVRRWLQLHEDRHDREAYQDLCDQYAHETDPRTRAKWAEE